MSQTPTLLELYKISDENHRFYVEKRFTIISFYFPAVALLSTGIHTLTTTFNQLVVCVFAFFLTLFLYSLENRNWILSNVCLQRCSEIGQRLDGASNLHKRLQDSYCSRLPEGETYLDCVVRKIANTQHRAVTGLTTFLFIYWAFLIAYALFISN